MPPAPLPYLLAPSKPEMSKYIVLIDLSYNKSKVSTASPDSSTETTKGPRYMS